jgi:uncharacterized protein
MPNGKPAGVRCIHLDAGNLCGLFGKPERPAVCSSLQAEPMMCGNDRAYALRTLAEWETLTAPAPRPLRDTRS